MKVYDVIIVGGGVTGTALLFTSMNYTNVQSVALLEKCSEVATINSDPLNNAQTSHDGSTETNYNLSHALEIKQAADLLRSYVKSKNDPTLFQVTNRMALAIGSEQVERLRKRFKEFKPHYPDLRFVEAAELAELEPKVMEGRDPNEEVAAMVSDQGFAINYKRLAEYLLEDSMVAGKDINISFNTSVGKVSLEEDGFYHVRTNKGELVTKVIVFAAGAYSLKFAQDLGYANNYTIFPVAGSFVTSPKVLNGKVYPMAPQGNPWAVPHGDPDILNPDITRWGPTTKPLPLMERHRYNTMKDYFRTGILSWKGLRSAAQILLGQNLLPYVLKNELYDMPIIGMRLFAKQVQMVVPTLRHQDLQLRRNAGGIRPQLVNMDTGKLEMGDSCIVKYNCIFNTTPSPGASICLGNAVRDTEQICKFLGGNITFNREQFFSDMNVIDRGIIHEVLDGK